MSDEQIQDLQNAVRGIGLDVGAIRGIMEVDMFFKLITSISLMLVGISLFMIARYIRNS
ncbi:MAG: hypothetical protein LBR23_05560 [Spirochaetaceae bacterium]|jgi:hypothetical protein|nr:hypothetical protein [Spirochaetaceae bacterium]